MFAFITWRGKPLLTHKIIVQLIAAASTASGLTVASAIDAIRYPKGAKGFDAEFAAINVGYGTFHPDWNYTILPGALRRASSN